MKLVLESREVMEHISRIVRDLESVAMLEHVQQSPVSIYDIIRNHAINLYNSLQERFSACQCPAHHSVNLRLEQVRVEGLDMDH